MKAEIDITRRAAYPLGRAVFWMIMNVDTFKNEVIVRYHFKTTASEQDNNHYKLNFEFIILIY